MDNQTPNIPPRDELDGVELLWLADLVARQEDASDYQELQDKLRRLSERYITTGR